MPSFNVETSLSVEDQGGFDTLETWKSLNAVYGGFKEMVHDCTSGQEIEYTVEDIKFVETDSNNISHAMAYYLVTYTCDQDLEDLLYPEIETQQNPL